MALTPDRKRAESALREFLAALGVEDSALSDTPARVTAAFVDELLSGYGVDVEALIREGSDKRAMESACDPVLVENLYVVTVCPHHLLPARGRADVAYIPGPRILGLGTVSRLVDAMSRRLVLQENIAPGIVDALMNSAGARGAFCRIRLNHDCLQVRGAEQHAATAVTWASRGELSDLEVLELILAERLP